MKDTKKEFSIHSYQANENEIVSWYVQSDEDFDEQEAWEALSEDIVEKVEFIEFDQAVASYCGFKCSATFHEIEE